MRRSVFELATVEPHEPAGRRVPAGEWPAYCAGYYRALQMALTVMELAEVRWRLYLRERRRRRLQAAAGASESWPLAQLDGGEISGALTHDFVEQLGQRRDFGARESQRDRVVPGRAHAVDAPELRITFEFDLPLNAPADDSVSHSPASQIDAKNTEPSIEGAKSIGPPCVPSTMNPSDPCGRSSARRAAEPTSSPGQSETTKPRVRRRRG